MGRFKNIVKIMILTVVILLSAMTRYAYAQNTSTTPFIDSWHKYHIVKGALSNSVTWWIQSDETLTPATRHDLSTLDAGGASWITIGNENIASVDYAFIEMKFISGLPASFASGQTWYLIYSEINSAGSCVARRSIKIDLVSNNFYLSLPDDNAGCNSYSGDTWANTIVNIDAADYESNVEFTVNMTKDATFLIDKWRFSGSITFPSGATHIATTPFPITVGVPASLGSWLITPAGGGNFILEVTTPANFAGTSDAVTFTVRVEGDVTQDFEIQLAITNGQAESGTLYIAETDDNLSLGGDRVVVRTIYGVPNTSLVTISP
jgi:hypothetical protein